MDVFGKIITIACCLTRLAHRHHPLLLGIRILQVLGKSTALASQLAGVLQPHKEPEWLLMANRWRSIHRDPQLDFVEQLLVVFE